MIRSGILSGPSGLRPTAAETTSRTTPVKTSVARSGTTMTSPALRNHGEARQNPQPNAARTGSASMAQTGYLAEIMRLCAEPAEEVAGHVASQPLVKLQRVIEKDQQEEERQRRKHPAARPTPEPKRNEDEYDKLHVAKDLADIVVRVDVKRQKRPRKGVLSETEHHPEMHQDQRGIDSEKDDQRLLESGTEEGTRKYRTGSRR